MGMIHWLGFLLGRRDAIERALSTRGLLALGLVFVASAALAREYDAEFIPHNPIVLAVPFVASAAAAFLLFAVFWFAARRKGWPANPEAPRAFFWPMFGRFLGVFWLTAPMAWLYGIPFERMLPELAAAEANLWMLAFVAFWRVALMVRVAQVMFGFRFWHALVLVLFFGDIAVLAVVFFAPWPVLEIMGGVQGDVDNMLANWRFFLGFWSALGFLVFVIPFFTTLFASANYVGGCVAPQTLLRPEAGKPNAALWALAVAALVAWAALLPFTQPPLENAKRRTSFLALNQLRSTAFACRHPQARTRDQCAQQGKQHQRAQVFAG